MLCENSQIHQQTDASILVNFTPMESKNPPKICKSTNASDVSGEVTAKQNAHLTL